MGGTGALQLTILFLVFCVPVVIIGVIVWLLARSSKTSTAASTAYASTLPVRASAESRLQELADLKAKGLITEVEYAERRAAMISEI